MTSPPLDSKLEKLRKGFASGMSVDWINDDQWNDEFLPMIEDAMIYDALFCKDDRLMHRLDSELMKAVERKMTNEKE